jgi:hypothetical protein
VIFGDVLALIESEQVSANGSGRGFPFKLREVFITGLALRVCAHVVLISGFGWII